MRGSGLTIVLAILCLAALPATDARSDAGGTGQRTTGAKTPSPKDPGRRPEPIKGCRVYERQEMKGASHLFQPSGWTDVGPWRTRFASMLCSNTCIPHIEYIDKAGTMKRILGYPGYGAGYMGVLDYARKITMHVSC